MATDRASMTPTLFSPLIDTNSPARNTRVLQSISLSILAGSFTENAIMKKPPVSETRAGVNPRMS